MRYSYDNAGRLMIDSGLGYHTPGLGQCPLNVGQPELTASCPGPAINVGQAPPAPDFTSPRRLLTILGIVGGAYLLLGYLSKRY